MEGMNFEASSASLLTKDQLQKLLAELKVGFITSTEPNTNTSILPPFRKLGVLIDIDDIEDAKETKATLHKNIVNTKTTQSQFFSCIQCRRQLPTAHLLDLHITEQHDLYFATSVERRMKPLYTCYIEECPQKFFLPADRKDHCIKDHKFPANYRFDQEKVTKVKNVKIKETNAMDVDTATSCTPGNDVKLPHIKTFSFGHPSQRTFNSRMEHELGKALLDVHEMKEALDDMD